MVLQYQLAYVRNTLVAAAARKERLEDLMSRKGAKKWQPAKKALMVRRLMVATQTVEQCTLAIDELTKKLAEVLAKLGPNPGVNTNVAPFVPPTPTSVTDAPAEEVPTEPSPEDRGFYSAVAHGKIPTPIGEGIENPFEE